MVKKLSLKSSVTPTNNFVISSSGYSHIQFDVLDFDEEVGDIVTLFSHTISTSGK